MKVLICLIYFTLLCTFGPLVQCSKKKKVKGKIKIDIDINDNSKDDKDDNENRAKYPQLLIVSLDGFGEKYFRDFPRETQTLRSLAEDALSGYKGTISSSARASVMHEPTTASILWSHTTGVSAKFHSIVNNKFYDSKLNETFLYKNNSNDVKWFKSSYEPLWSIAEKQNRKVYAVDWIGSRVNFPSNISLASYTDLPDVDHSLDTMLNNALHLLKGNAVQLAMINFKEPGFTASRDGSSSISLRRTLESIDNSFRELKKGLKMYKLYSSINLIVISDSAFVDVNEVIYLSNFTEKGNNCTLHSITTGAMSHFWGKNATCVAKLLDQLSTLSRKSGFKFRVVRKNEILRPGDPVDLDHRTGDIVLMARPGVYIQLNGKNETLPRAIQGYSGTDELVRPIFIARGPTFNNKRLRSRPCREVNYFNFFCQILAIRPPFGLQSSNKCLTSLFIISSTTTPNEASLVTLIMTLILLTVQLFNLHSSL